MDAADQRPNPVQPRRQGLLLPDGLLGAIHLPTGYASAATGLEAWPAKPKLATEVMDTG